MTSKSRSAWLGLARFVAVASVALLFLWLNYTQFELPKDGVTSLELAASIT